MMKRTAIPAAIAAVVGIGASAQGAMITPAQARAEALDGFVALHSDAGAKQTMFTTDADFLDFSGKLNNAWFLFFTNDTYGGEIGRLTYQGIDGAFGGEVFSDTDGVAPWNGAPVDDYNKLWAYNATTDTLMRANIDVQYSAGKNIGLVAFSPVEIPEPATGLALGLGAAALGYRRRKD